MNAIEIRNISKSYGSVTALDDISLSVGRGELFGLIGPDGAGKTTMFRILATLIDPDQGNATVAGLDIGDSYRSIRSRIGYMPGRFSLYPDLSVRENLNFFASLFNVTVADNHSMIAPHIFADRAFRFTQSRQAVRRHETETRTVLRTDPQA